MTDPSADEKRLAETVQSNLMHDEAWLENARRSLQGRGEQRGPKYMGRSASAEQRLLRLLDASRARLMQAELERDEARADGLYKGRTGHERPKRSHTAPTMEQQLEDCEEALDDTIARADAAEERASALAAALKRYGKHDLGCDLSGMLREPHGDCACGFQKAREALSLVH